MAISNITKQNIVKKYGKSEKDCGSSEVQIALLTENINSLVIISQIIRRIYILEEVF